MENDSFDFGRRPALGTELAALDEPGLTGGRVVAQHSGLWMVAVVGGATEPQLLSARSRMRADPPVVGDWVAVDSAGAIFAVLARHGTLKRRAAGEATLAQVLAANVDLTLVVEPLPDPNQRRLERLVSMAVSDSVPAVLVLSKTDLYPDGAATAERLAPQLPVVSGMAISAIARTGLDELQAMLEPGATVAVIGRSGAGKSTLVNALLGIERQATKPIRASDGRGRHVTVTRELIELPNGTLIIDTPGLREIGLWEGADEVFTEIEALSGDCRFTDCRHETEPGCAVREVVDPEELAAWRKLEQEQAELADRKAVAAERKEKGRALSKRVKAAKRADRQQ